MSTSSLYRTLQDWAMIYKWRSELYFVDVSFKSRPGLRFSRYFLWFSSVLPNNCHCSASIRTWTLLSYAFEFSYRLSIRLFIDVIKQTRALRQRLLLPTLIPVSSFSRNMVLKLFSIYRKCSDIDKKFHIVSYFYCSGAYLTPMVTWIYTKISVFFPNVRPVACNCSPSVQSYLDIIAF
jgi:hypothetical protein